MRVRLYSVLVGGGARKAKFYTAYLDGIFARKALQRTLGTFFVRKAL